MRHVLAAVLVFVLGSISCYAQPTTEKIREYLQTSRFELGPEAKAIVLYERTTVNTTTSTTSVHKMIKILNNEALSMANVKLTFPLNNANNYIYKLQGKTYNLADGAVKVSPLPGGDNYQKKVVKSLFEVDFTMPEVKVGSIIEYSYDLVSASWMDLSWSIQEDLPKLTAEFAFMYPQGANIITAAHSSHKLIRYSNPDSAAKSTAPFSVYKDPRSSLSYTLWTRRNVPAAKDEPFVYNSKNHKERLDIQDGIYSTWTEVDKLLLGSEPAQNAKGVNAFLTDIIASIVKDDTDQLIKAKKIYSWVRSNIKLNENSQLADGEIRPSFYSREATLMNMVTLLTAMLHKAGLDAHLLVLSTNRCISPDELLAIRSRFDYVATALNIGGYYLFLDPSDKNNMFGMLPYYCYNGYSRLVAKTPEGIYLNRDLLENKSTRMVNMRFVNDSTYRIELVEKIGLLESILIRKSAKNIDNPVKTLIDNYSKSLSAEYTFVSGDMLNLDNPDTNLVVKVVYEGTIDAKASKWVLSTKIADAIESKNPFPATERVNPVEFNWRSSKQTYFNVYLPANYTVESLPEPAEMALGENSMVFKRTMSFNKEAGLLTIASNFTNSNVTYSTVDYQSIRDFYSDIIKENNKFVELKKSK